MRDVAKILPPRRLIDVFEESFSGSSSHTQALWDAFGDATGQVMALGVRTLAMIWDAAWKAGGGDTDHGRIDPGILRGHYEDVNFLRSVTVDGIENEIANPTAVGGGAGDTQSRAARRQRPRPAAKRAVAKKAAKAAKRKKR